MHGKMGGGGGGGGRGDIIIEGEKAGRKMLIFVRLHRSSSVSNDRRDCT